MENREFSNNSVTFTAETYLAPYAVNEWTTFFAFGAANTDGINHFKTLGKGFYGMEDIIGGGDGDYNDLVFGLVPTGAL